MYLCNKPLPQEAEKKIKFFFVAAQISKEQIFVLQRTWQTEGNTLLDVWSVDKSKMKINPRNLQI